MKTITAALSIFFLCCFPVFSENSDNIVLSNAIKQVSCDLESIRNEARTYLELGKTSIESQEDVVVLARKISLEYLENTSKRAIFDFGSPFLKDVKNKKAEKEAAIRQALANNDTATLLKLSREILEAKREKIIDEAVSLMRDLANGKKTPRGRRTTTTITNGKTVKKEEVTIAEVEKLERLKSEYCIIISDLKKITANQRVLSIAGSARSE